MLFRHLAVCRSCVKIVLVMTAVVFASIFGAASAQARFEWIGLSGGTFASKETEGELGGRAGGVAVNYGCFAYEGIAGHTLNLSECEARDPSNGRVYVADGIHSRVTVFNTVVDAQGDAGSLQLAEIWGWGVIKSGPGIHGTATVDALTVRATGGRFRLRLTMPGENGQGAVKDETELLNYNATSGQVEEALDQLGSVKDFPEADFTVTGGPGDEEGTKPYLITFGGSLVGRGVLAEGESLEAEDVSLIGGKPFPSAVINVMTEGTPASESCVPANKDVCRSKGIADEGEGQFVMPVGVAVDQATGHVYVREGDRVQIFTAEGKYLSSLGVEGGVHNGIAIDQGTGDLYVVSEGRVKVFKPVAENYVYEKEFALGDGPEEVAIDSAGDVYVTGEAKFVYKFAAGDLAEPEWVHTDNKEIDGLTANPGNDEDVFYYTNQNRRFHELKSMEEMTSPVGAAKGIEWPGVEIEEEVNGKLEKRQESETNGLAFSPGLTQSTDRPKGILYAIDPHLFAGLVFAEPPLLEPSVGGLKVSGVGSGSAVFEAGVNPHGVDTSYRFEYGVEDCVEHVCDRSVPVPVEGDVGSGGVSRVVSASVGGLLPGTKYYFRVVVSSHCKSGEPSVVCSVSDPVVAPADSFTTFSVGGSGLVDGRVFELVSPVVKNGGEVFPLSASTRNCELCMPGVSKDQFPRQVSVDGSRVVYEGDPFAVVGDAVSENEYLSVRGAGGVWGGVPRDLSPVLAGKATPQGYVGFSSDLSRGVLYEIEQSFAGAPLGYPDLYVEDTSSGGLTPLVTEAPSNVTGKEFGLTFAGASSDFSHIIFGSDGVLATESGVSAPAGGGLYEWVNGKLRLVNILPDEATESGAEFGSGTPDFDNAISADGSRIFWTDTNSGGGHAGHVFVRVNGEKTLEVMDPEDGAFVTASKDGSKVLLSDGRVFNVAGAAASVEEADLTDGQGGFQGILGASDDLSTIYFVDTAVLTGTEENAEGAEAVGGKDNLYVWRDGAAKFVAGLAGGDNATDVAQGDHANFTGDWAGSASTRTARVTSDGEYAAFMSEEELVGGTNSEGVFEVYEFDAGTGGLVCASCNPTRETPLGPSTLSVVQPGSGFLPQPMNLSENGRLFFDSYDQLVPQDSNGSFEDVYEYEPDGLGSCGVSSGCISLISSGQEDTNSSFVTATPSGSDVFFTTYSRLVPQDQDELMDLYDARVDGVPAPALPSPPCAGDACKGPLSSPVSSETLSSTVITGSGNVLASPLSVPPPPSKPKSSPRPLTRAQLLTKALKACRKTRANKAKRVACEKHARKSYGPVIRTKKTSKTGNKK
jgi:hypothetical protein